MPGDRDAVDDQAHEGQQSSVAGTPRANTAGVSALRADESPEGCNEFGPQGQALRMPPPPRPAAVVEDDEGPSPGAESCDNSETHDSDGEEEDPVDANRDLGESEEEDLRAGHAAKKFVCNDAERARIIGFMTDARIATVTVKSKEFQRLAREVARRIRSFRPTDEQEAEDQETFDCGWRVLRAASATASTVGTIRRPLSKWHGEIKYGKEGENLHAVMKRKAVGRKSSHTLYALDCAVDAFYVSKRKRTSSSTANAEESKKKARQERLSAQEMQEKRNKEYMETRRKAREEKEKKSAEKQQRQEKTVELLSKLAENQNQVAENSKKLADTAATLAGWQTKLIQKQMERMDKD